MLNNTEEVLRELFSEGKTDQQIASRFGFGRNRVADMRRSIGIPDKRTRC
jgi:DNA-binding CsgD family transcriptional regulator